MPTTYTLGKLLAETRDSRGLSVEKVAHETRIGASTIRCLENDDYSQFPNLVYARSFLRLYSKHLDVEASEFLEELDALVDANDRGQSYFSGQFNPKELREISSWKNYVPVRPILTVLFFMAVGVPAAWWVSKLYLDREQETMVESIPTTSSLEPADFSAEESSGADGLSPNGTAVGAEPEVAPALTAGPVIPEDLLNAPRAGAVIEEPADAAETPQENAESGEGEVDAAENAPEVDEDGAPVASTGNSSVF
ncbi:MAG: helix-turn-helix domain-containing protein [Verrucomicrobiota bacterium]